MIGDNELTSLEHLTKEELVKRIQGLEEDLRMTQAFMASPKSDSLEDVQDAALHWPGHQWFLTETPIPVKLEPIRAESLFPQQGSHWIIDGDNLSVMASLLTDFRGGPNSGFDIIYMDPPYNTGEDIFSYNDDYTLSRAEVKAYRRRRPPSESLVSLDDPTRHTKWINHIAPRLWIAKKLMKYTGVIMVSIDEHELPRLWMLMERIFEEKNRIATLIWDRSIKNDAKYISEGHEYILIWARDKAALDTKALRMADTIEWKKEKGRWRKKKEGADDILTAYAEAKQQYGDDIPKIQAAMDIFFDSLPENHPAQRIRYKKVNKIGVYNNDQDLSWPKPTGGYRYDYLHPSTGQPCKIPTRGWRIKKEEMEKLHAQNRIDFKEDHRKVPRLITYLHEMENEVQTSIIRRVGQRSVEMVEAVLGKNEFTNPKDHEMLAELFNLVAWRNKETVILDPYAGSGTTGHAVISMNVEDGGNRRFILIENGDPTHRSKELRERYTSEVTAERIRRVITGKWADGKEHPIHDSGFTFFRARDEITEESIMNSTRESLADIILQVVEEDSNKIDYRFDGYTYLIGRTRSGCGIALVWGPNKEKHNGRVLTWEIRNKILAEARAAGVSTPIYIYASANSSPLNSDLYRFCQIPNWILIRLGIAHLSGRSDEYQQNEEEV